MNAGRPGSPSLIYSDVRFPFLIVIEKSVQVIIVINLLAVNSDISLLITDVCSLLLSVQQITDCSLLRIFRRFRRCCRTSWKSIVSQQVHFLAHYFFTFQSPVHNLLTTRTYILRMVSEPAGILR